ncbi:MAG: DNA pilot protein [Microviridae sp.]|nr:MAG: DNA pilot protein [Microviridae sp.]
MEPISTGAMLGMAGISGLTSLAGGFLGNRSAAQEAKKNREFQLMMSSTAHQREVEDLRAAGLNPILSATGGPGASTPSGSTASQSDPITPAVSSAMQMFKISMEQNLIQAQAQREQASALKTLAEANLVPLQGPLLQGQSFSAFAHGRKLNEETQNQAFVRQLLSAQTLSEKSKANLNSGNLEIVQQELKTLKNQGTISDTEYGKVLAFIKRGVDTIGPLLPWFSRATGGYQRHP